MCYKPDVARFELFWLSTCKLAKLVLDGHTSFPGFDTAGISSNGPCYAGPFGKLGPSPVRGCGTRA